MASDFTLMWTCRNFSSSMYHSRTPLFQAPFRVVYGCQNHACEVVAMKTADLDTKGANMLSRVRKYIFLLCLLVCDLTVSQVINFCMKACPV